MNTSYARDLDLNLLRVFVVVAESGSVTAAAARLYLTQPAVSAALARLQRAIGASLFVRQGRGLALSARGRSLLAAARPHLEALIEAARTPAVFDPRTSERSVRIGLSDSAESWLLPGLLRRLARVAPRMRLLVLPVQFRTVAGALSAAAIDLAITVADELPADARRATLLSGGFVCVSDPRHARLGARPSLKRYLEHDHLIVSYNGDLRGVVEDALGIERRVRVSVPSFHSVGAVIEGSALVATVPEVVAEELRELRPRLAIAPTPFSLSGTPLELVWRAAVDDDDAVALTRREILLEVEARQRPRGRHASRSASKRS